MFESKEFRKIYIVSLLCSLHASPGIVGIVKHGTLVWDGHVTMKVYEVSLLCSLHASPSIVGIVKHRTLLWDGHVTMKIF
jgi:hypothetical protein